MTGQLTFNLKCSEEQIMAIEDHLFFDKELIVAPSERIRIAQICNHKFPGAKILNAHLDYELMEWVISLDGAKNEETQAEKTGKSRIVRR